MSADDEGSSEPRTSRLAGHVRAPLAAAGAEGYRIGHGLLSDPAFFVAQMEARGFAGRRSSVPGARKGGSVPYYALREARTLCAALYASPEMRAVVQAMSGISEPLKPLASDRPHACSLLVYDRPGDRITWHYDTNYFRGQTVTVLVTLVNRDRWGGCCSANRNCARLGGSEQCVATPENSVVVLHGSRVLHSAQPLGEGEQRVVLSMVYSTDPSSTPLQRVGMAVKDWSFFG